MKLLNKTSIYYLLFAIPVFAICSAFLYYLISSEIIDNLDESLLKEKTELEQKLKSGIDYTSLQDDEVHFRLIDGFTKESSIHFLDTTLYDASEQEVLPFRGLTTVINDGVNNFEVFVLRSYIESDDLISSILYPVIILFVILLAGFFLINWYVSKKLWKPFYQTLEQLTNYKITEETEKFANVNIKEFSELNNTLTAMTKKMHEDFINQKQFIENASHEIQTPLAVIKSKIELLIQSKNLNESDVQIIQAAYNASNKLSSLNKALLLLSKIENNQFKEIETIGLISFIEKTLEHFEDLAEIKNIKIEKNYSSELKIKMNPILAEILISNLIQNAIRHNVKDGTIKIDLMQHSFSISNTSDSNIENTQTLFNRFHKNEASAESIGLGLAIVKEICDKYLIEIEYSCMNNIHIIKLTF